MYYKYVSSETLEKILINKTILFNNPVNFNDPFDCCFPGLSPHYQSKIEKAIKKTIKHNKYIPKKNQVLEKEINNLTLEITKELKKLLSDLKNDWDGLISEFRILCLTKDSDNLLLWSHYADSHQGVVLGLNIDEGIMKPVKVKYCTHDKRIEVVSEQLILKLIEIGLQNEFNNQNIEINENPFSEIFLKTLLSYFFIKRNEWSYEKEFRIVVKSDAKLLTNDSIPLDSKLLKTVIYGIKFKNAELKEKLKSQFPDIEECIVEKKDDELFIKHLTPAST